MMNVVARGISKEGVLATIFDVGHTHVSYILPSLWTQRGVMVGAPTYEGGLFPLVTHVLEDASHKKVRNKKAARFGSYGWSGGAQREFERLVDEMKWELIETLEWVGKPTDEDLKRGEELGARFARAVRQVSS
jgi:anaerobic nitric oxide reductase flavorubredoxin